MTGTINLNMTLAPIRSLRHVNLTQPSVQMFSMHSNNIELTLECETHADSWCIGRHIHTLNNYDIPVTLYGYDHVLCSQKFRKVYAAVAYTDPMTGNTYNLMIHQAIEIPHLDHHLLFPMKCLVNGVMINYTPKFLTNDPTPQTHVIMVDIEDSDAENDKLIVPLSMKDLTSYLPVHKLTKE